MGWKIAGTEFTTLNVTSCSISKNAGGKDKATLTMAREGDAAAPLTVDAFADILHPDGATYAFRGLVRSCYPVMTGASESWRVELSGKLETLAEIVYKQSRACVPATSGGAIVQKYDSSCVLGWSAAGARQNTVEIITDVLAYGATQSSAITTGTILSGVTITVPQMEVTDATCLEAINSTLRWHPDSVLWFDHAAGVVNVTRPGAMATVTKQGTGAAVHLSTAPRVVRKARGVSIHWRTTSTLDDQEQVDVVTDSAGETTGRRVVNITIPLNGSQTTTQSQAIETVAIPQTVGDLTGANAAYGEQWLLDHFPEIAETAPGSGLVVVTDVSQVVDEDGEMGPGATLSEYPRELINGQITEWMSGISAAPTEVTVTLKYTGDRLTNPKLYDLFKGADNTLQLKIKLTGTDAMTRTYSTSATIPGESPPTGLAADYYAALNIDWPEGTVSWAEDEIDLTLTPGKRLTITGDVPVTTALIQSVEFDIMTGKSTVRFGPAGRLEPNDFVELLRAGTRARPLVNTSGAFRTATAPSGGSNVRGSNGGRVLNTSNIAPGRALYGFEVTQKSATGTTSVNVSKGVASFWQPGSIDSDTPSPIQNIGEIVYAGGSINVTTGQHVWLKVDFTSVVSGTDSEYNTWSPSAVSLAVGTLSPTPSATVGYIKLAYVTIADGVMTIEPYHVGNLFLPTPHITKIAAAAGAYDGYWAVNYVSSGSISIPEPMLLYLKLYQDPTTFEYLFQQASWTHLASGTHGDPMTLSTGIVDGDIICVEMKMSPYSTQYDDFTTGGASAGTAHTHGVQISHVEFEPDPSTVILVSLPPADAYTITPRHERRWPIAEYVSDGVIRQLHYGFIDMCMPGTVVSDSPA